MGAAEPGVDILRAILKKKVIGQEWCQHILRVRKPPASSTGIALVLLLWPFLSTLWKSVHKISQCVRRAGYWRSMYRQHRYACRIPILADSTSRLNGVVKLQETLNLRDAPSTKRHCIRHIQRKTSRMKEKEDRRDREERGKESSRRTMDIPV